MRPAVGALAAGRVLTRTTPSPATGIGFETGAQQVELLQEQGVVLIAILPPIRRMQSIEVEQDEQRVPLMSPLPRLHQLGQDLAVIGLGDARLEAGRGKGGRQFARQAVRGRKAGHAQAHLGQVADEPVELVLDEAQGLRHVGPMREREARRQLALAERDEPAHARSQDVGIKLRARGKILDQPVEPFRPCRSALSRTMRLRPLSACSGVSSVICGDAGRT